MQWLTLTVWGLLAAVVTAGVAVLIICLRDDAVRDSTPT